MTFDSIDIPATLLDIRKVSEWVQGLVLDGPVPADTVGRIDLALVEVCTNIVTHGYGDGSDNPPPDDHGGRLGLSAELTEEGLEVKVVETADPFDPDSIPMPDPGEPTVHGYGLMIVRQLTDHLSVDQVDGKNVWTLVFPVLIDGLARN